MSTITAAPGPDLRPSNLTSSRVGGVRKFKNGLAATLITGSFLVALVPLVWLLYTVIGKGLHAVTRNGWFTESQRNITPTTPGGGALAAITGTAETVALATVISVPVGLLVGIYLVEYGRGWFAKLTTFMVDILTGVPSVVAALFIFAVFINSFGASKASWLVSMALILLMIPVIVRTTEEMLRLVPNELREASYALGIPKWKTVMRVVIPTAFSGIVTGIVLGIARVAGETAPLLILAIYTPNRNNNLFNGPQGTLPTLIKDQINNYTSKGTYQLGADGKPVLVQNFAIDRLWGAALTLIIIVMALNLIARLISRSNTVAK